MQIVYRKILLVILLFSAVFCTLKPVYADSSDPDTKDVLLLNSYHHGFDWTDTITSSITDFFDIHHSNITLNVENMDTKNHSTDFIFPIIYGLYNSKYSDKQPDVIISSDNNALAFLLKYRDSLFPGVPIVFCGVNNFTESMIAGHSNITGIVENVSDIATIDMAIKMNPSAKNLYLLACSAVTSKEHIRRFKKEGKAVSEKINTVILHDLTKEEYEKEFAKIKDSDIILNYGFHYTKDKYTPNLAQAYEFIREFTNAPIFTLWESYADFATAGVMIDGRTQGSIAASIAMEILSGTPVSEIPIVTESPNIPIINFRDLNRIGQVDRIRYAPENTIIINKPFSFYEHYKWLVWGVVGIITGLSILIFFLYINIRTRKYAEKELRLKQKNIEKQKENLRITLSSIAEGVIATDIDGIIQQINPVAERLTGWTSQTAINKSVSEVFTLISSDTRDKINNTVGQAISTGEIISQTNAAILISRNKDEYQISDSAAPIIDGSGEITGAVLVFRDITAENAIQRQLHQSRKMDAIGQLAGGIAHDFNNMLGGILSAADLAKINIDKNEDPTKFINIITDAVERAAALTSKLLAFSRQQPKSSTPINVNNILKDSIALISNTVDKRIRIHPTLANKTMNVIGDPSLLQSAFINLMINASQAMPEGGDLFISSEIISLNNSYCNASNFDLTPGDYIEIEIRDTGCGIKPENISKIFEPFFTTKSVGKGTGLGLSAVFGTVQQHKGSVSVYSEPGTGTSFHLLLPLSEKANPKIRLNTEPSDSLSGSGAILLVDDEEIMRITAKAILEELGYHVLLAGDGKEACKVFSDNSETIKMVILDMVMPEMNGKDCFKEIRKIKPDAKVIISSGFSRPEELSELNNEGLAGFIHKPFRASELGRIVREVILN